MILAVVLPVILSSCVDEINAPDLDIPEGETTMLTEIRFSPLVTANLNGTESRSNGMEFGPGNTVAPNGTAMDEISSLYLLFYTPDGELIEEYTHTVDLTKYKPELEERTDNDAVNGSAAEDRTYCVTVPLTIKNGKYKIFAVGNIENLPQQYASEIKTIAGLRNIKVSWARKNIAGNREMFGFFTNGKVNTRELDFEKEAIVTISSKSTERMIHSWIRRVVSKLTIDFDGSKLRDNVFVYIQEARVYDIASGAYLGHYSCVGETPERNDAIAVKGGFEFVSDGSAHRLTYGSGTDYKNWPQVTNGKNLDSYELDGKKVNFHDATAYCLPFYENMQGVGKCKFQDSDGDGIIDNPLAGEHEGTGNDRKWKHEEAKDSKPNGTFVEVVGYYESRNNDYVTGGPIKYRFMLGKNIRDNYDVERNHHYKLTLAFKGNGNDADWHIEYDESTGIHLPNPLYISYLYNKSMTFPVRINTGGKKVKDIEIKITKSNWAPYHDLSAGLDVDYYKDADIKSDYGKAKPELGFLSLIKTTSTIITVDGTEDNLTKIKNYYEKEIASGEGFNINRGLRKYLATPGPHGNEEVGTYVVRQEGDVLELEVPLYTRAKQLIKESAYTGNNPYVGYPREAEIEVTAHYTDGTSDSQSTPVYQVRRLVNPKAIYRNHDNNTSFDVTLYELSKETATDFTALTSIGPWRAYVLYEDGDFIDLNGAKECSDKTLTPVKFKVNFKGKTDANKNRFAIIDILYHNYSCHHQIYVRQGDAPVQMYSNQTDKKNIYWHTKNMLTKNKEVDNILDEGSLFRFGKWDYPIDASNNTNTKDPWSNITPADFIKPSDNYLIAGTGSTYKSWAEIGSSNSDGSFADQKDSSGNIYSLPNAMEISWLRMATNQGFGVLYGDQATQCESNVNKAYGYQRDSNGNADPTNGMRGCVVYVDNKESAFYGRNLFFPIGASGYGHRRHSGTRGWGDSEQYDGQLRYAAGRTKEMKFADNPLTMPLFYDLYKRPGAIYWSCKIGNGIYVDDITVSKDNLGLDINYFTFDFNNISARSLYGGPNRDMSKNPPVDNPNTFDACFIRCVDRK